jgi:hypothetical protein
MDKKNTNAALAEVIDMCYQTTRNDSFQPDTDFLEKHDFSPASWKCFVELIKDLDLNEMGVKIMLEEIWAGRYVLQCDR